MPTAVVERYGSLSATGFAKETAFGSAAAPSVFVPMTGNGLELDPGLFSPKVMMATRESQVFPLYGQNKIAGSLSAPLLPTQGMGLVAGAIGGDAAAGNGVTGSGSASPTTLSSPITAATNTAVLTSATGYTIGSIVQVDVNAAGPVTTSEVRKVTAVATNTLTLDAPFTYAHLTGAAVKVVTAPFTHTIVPTPTLPSFTVEKNLGNFESLIFSGARINKLGLQVQAGNQEAALSLDLMAKHAQVQAVPTAPTYLNESPYVFAEATANLLGTAVTQATQFDFSLENGLKDTYTLNQSHDLQFLTPVTIKVGCKVDLVFTSLDDPTWGYWTQMVNGSEGAVSLALTHPANAGSTTLNMPRCRIRTSGDAVKMEDAIITTLQFDAFMDFTTLRSVSATVVNGNYLPY